MTTSDRPATERERAENTKTVAEACGCPAKPGEPCPLSEIECLRRIEASLTDAERAEVARRLSSLPPVRAEGETDFVADLVAQIEAQDDAVLSDPTKQAPWHVAYSEGLRWVLRLLEKPPAPVRAEEPTDYRWKCDRCGLRYSATTKPPSMEFVCLCGEKLFQVAALPPVQEPPKRWKECCRGCSGRFDLADKECECGGMLMTVCEDIPASSPSQGVRLGDLKALLDGAAVTCDSSPGDRRVSIRFGNDLKRAQAFYRWLSAALEGADNGKS